MPPNDKTIQLWHLLLGCLLFAIAASFDAYSREPRRCVLCRAEETRYHILGSSFSTGFKDTSAFTQWYQAHRPPHEHQWHYSGGGCLLARNFFGLPITRYRMKSHPLIGLRQDEVLAYVENQDEATLTQFFSDAISTDLEKQRTAAASVRGDFVKHKNANP